MVHRIAEKLRVLASVAVLAFGFHGTDAASAQAPSTSLGVFESQSDVGNVTPPRSVSFNAATGVYSVHSAGSDLFGNVDDFHFVWKKLSGDVSLTADVTVPEGRAGAHFHRKALLMIRQALGTDDAYADAAIHASGEMDFQYRRSKGGSTADVAVTTEAPQRVRIQKRGDTITLFMSKHGEPLHLVGATTKLHFDGEFYVGIGFCSHKKEETEQALFGHVDLQQLAVSETGAPATLFSTLQTLSLGVDLQRTVIIRSVKGRMEAPNWSRDGKTLVFDYEGKLWSVPATGGEAQPIDISNLSGCTGSHGLSPDGKWLAMTCNSADHADYRLYIAPAGGGTPRMLTPNPYSFFHSWSPDGKTIAFTRPSHGAGNIYSIPVDGGEETALTACTGICDDPDYSLDGQWIYFNSDRAGGMQIWRMKPDGSHPEQLTFDEMHNWTPHPSPDGKSVLILSYGKDVAGHANNQDVTLRILNPADGKILEVAHIVGGGGTDNVPNWAPDSKHFAFVSYQLIPTEDNNSPQ